MPGCLACSPVQPGQLECQRKRTRFSPSPECPGAWRNAQLLLAEPCGKFKTPMEQGRKVSPAGRQRPRLAVAVLRTMRRAASEGALGLLVRSQQDWAHEAQMQRTQAPGLACRTLPVPGRTHLSAHSGMLRGWWGSRGGSRSLGKGREGLEAREGADDHVFDIRSLPSPEDLRSPLHTRRQTLPSWESGAETAY